MHLYYFNKKRLEKTLAKFAGGQFLMVTKEKWVLRGEISDCFVPDERSRRVLISFSWLSERRFVFDRDWQPIAKWYLLKPPVGQSRLDVGFTAYYTQTDEDRVKMWGELGETCHFFKIGDPTNLVRRGDEFVPYCQLHQLRFWRAIIVLLSSKRPRRKAATHPSQPLIPSAHSR